MTGAYHRPAVFLDRDGTIIVEREYLADPDGVELEDGAAEGLRRMAATGRVLVVLTNQSGIGRGYFDRSAADAVNRRVADLLWAERVAIAGWYVCPHAPTEDCACRKPRAGLAERAARDLGLTFEDSWVVGDKRSDVELAGVIGASAILVESGHGPAHRAWAASNGILCAPDLVEAATTIAARPPMGRLARST